MATTVATQPSRLETLPAELQHHIARKLTSSGDLASLRLTCSKVYGAATDGYAESFPKCETIEVSKATVEGKIECYHALGPQMAHFVKSVTLTFADSQTAQEELKDARWLVDYPEAYGPNQLRPTKQSLKERIKTLCHCTQALKDVRSRQSESVSVPRLLALFPMLQKLELVDLGELTARNQMRFTDLHKALAHKGNHVKVLELRHCRLSSGHVRLLLAAFAKLQHFEIAFSIITDDWTSALAHIYLQSTPLKHLLIFSWHTELLPKDQINERDDRRELQRKYRTWDNFQMQSNVLQANGPLAVKASLEKILKYRMGGEEKFREGLEGAAQEKKREKDLASSGWSG